MTKKKPEQLESREDTINRGKSNSCRITMAEEALKNQNDKIERVVYAISNIERAMTSTTKEPAILKRLEMIEKILPCLANGHKWQYRFSANVVGRVCVVCGKEDWNVLVSTDKLLNKIKKLFK